MNVSLKQLDPNFIIYFENKGTNQELLLNKLQTEKIPAFGSTTVNQDDGYAYVRLDPTEDRLLDLFDVITNLKYIKKVVPIYDQSTQKRINYYVRNILRNILKTPNEKELIALTTLSGDPDLGLYFIYFTYYMKSLFVAGILGLGFRFYYGSRESEFNLSYTLSIVLWSIFFTINWIYYRKPYYVSKLYQTQKISFTDIVNKNKLGNESSHKSILLKKIIFVPIVLVFMIGLVFLQLSCFSLEIFVTQLYDGNYIGVFSLIPPILLSVLTPILLAVYNLIFVNPFVTLENGPAPKSSKLEKNIPFLFLMNFSPLLITLFLYYPFGSVFAKKWSNEFRPQLMKEYTLPLKKTDFIADKNRHNAQIIYFTITNQIILLTMDNILPIILNKVTQFITGSNKPTSKQSLTKLHIMNVNPSEIEYWEQGEFYKDNVWGNFDVDENMKKLILQLGFVMLFSTIWPLTPLVYLTFNLVVFRADLVRSLHKCTPSSIPNNLVAPLQLFTQHHSSLGSWDVILQITTWLGTIISPLASLMYHHRPQQMMSSTNLGSKTARGIRYLNSFLETKSNIPVIMGLEQLSLLLLVVIYKVCTTQRHNANSSISKRNTTRETEKYDTVSIAAVVSSRNNKLMDNIPINASLAKSTQAIAIGTSTSINEGKTGVLHSRRRGTTLPTDTQPHIEIQRSINIKAGDETTPMKDMPQSETVNETQAKHRNSIISMEKFIGKLKPHHTPHEEIEYPPPEVYTSAKYHEMNETHFPETLRENGKQREHRSASLSSTSHMPSVSPNSLAATAAMAALSGEGNYRNIETKNAKLDRSLEKSEKRENVLRNVTNTERQSSTILKRRSQKNDPSHKTHIPKPETPPMHKVKRLNDERKKIPEEDSKKKKGIFSKLKNKI
ncbi:similar to Saccharomyces cerevisiae YBR086C IST2 Plasma membrane protein that may be involved in osmotolerance [Maudiozyma saulgeensis]|uniref:Similar to Saccharomyces cerevisiae YBR086C IST2 Plasma membrane protein that may be involved in osmotolerance n=1 Tax=Maudiozyma saulgeensis TaxID=1789683 RepID=A0A1X7R3V9_9SACH|nr:similar to Saccharomyces cerevisiae YBR086C IST2 Plasma membrane protein that may be involved in osmotolerance [Kazachstania saulgeensis]